MVSTRRPRFIRLVTGEIHLYSGHALGVFHAVRYLRDDGALSRKEEAVADRVFDWMADHLGAPPAKLLREYPRAISWFHRTARDHIARAEVMAQLLAKRGIAVRRLERIHPGQIIFADEHQAFAVPRARSLLR